MTPSRGIEPGPPWREASALTTAPILHPCRAVLSQENYFVDENGNVLRFRFDGKNDGSKHHKAKFGTFLALMDLTTKRGGRSGCHKSRSFNDIFYLREENVLGYESWQLLSFYQRAACLLKGARSRNFRQFQH